MKQEPENKELELIKADLLKQATAISFANSLVRVNGKRCTLPLEGRDIEIVYYTCPEEDRKTPAPLIIGFHGGGFIFGGCALDDSMWVNVSKVLHADVAAIGYRKGPEHMWRDCLADCYDSAVYLASHSDEFGFDPENISLMGQSAGGNLAATTMLLINREKSISIKNQILVYPLLDLVTDPDDKGSGSFTGAVPKLMNSMHIDPSEAADPFASPLFATSDMLEGLPNTVIIVCENDNLRPEALKYGEMLKEAGCSVSAFTAAGMPHAFFESGFKKRITEVEFNMLGPTGHAIVEDGSLRARSAEALEFIKNKIV